MEARIERSDHDLMPGAARSATSPRLAGGAGGGLFIGGAAIAIAAILLPHPSSIDATGYWYLAAAEMIVGVALLCWARAGGTSRRWIAPTTIAGAILAVTVSIYLNGERDGGVAVMSEIFYVWPAVFAGYFFRWELAAIVVAAVAAAYVGVEIVIGIESSAIVSRALVVVSVVGGTAAVAYVLRRYVAALVGRLDGLARTDILTGLTNRRGFDERLDEELRRYRRTGEPAALMLGDIDHFKAINDRFGHACGDEVLRRLGRVFTESARSVDTAARIGGEEFALLMPATTPADALLVAERLRGEVATVRDPRGRSIQISFGVASTESERCFDSDSLLSAADRALYAAKARGRDRTVAFEELDSPAAAPA